MLTSEKPLCFFVQLGGYQTHVAGVPASLYAPWAIRSALPEATACESALAAMPSRAACPEVNKLSEAESSFIIDM